MNAEVFQIMILAAIPLLIVEIFIGVDYFGVNRRFDAILTAMTYVVCKEESLISSGGNEYVPEKSI